MINQFFILIFKVSLKSRDSSDSSKYPKIKFKTKYPERYATQYNNNKESSSPSNQEIQFFKSFSILSPIPDPILVDDKSGKSNDSRRMSNKPLGSPDIQNLFPPRALGSNAILEGKKYIDDFSLSEIRENSPGLSQNSVFQFNNHEVKALLSEVSLI